MALLALVVGLTVGCAGPREVPPPPELRVPPVSPGEPRVEGDAAQPLQPGEIFPLEARQARYRIVDGRNEGQVLTIRFEQAGAGDLPSDLPKDLPEDLPRGSAPTAKLPGAGAGVPAGAWLMVTEGVRTATLGRSEDGSIVLLREVEDDENVIVDYEPALVLLPAALPMGQAFEQQVKMTVRHLSSGAVRDQGTCATRIDFVGRRDVEAPAGVFACSVIRAVRHIDLPVAKVTVTTDAAYAPQVGMVAQRIVRQTQALGLFGGMVTQEIRLLNAPGKP